MLDNFSTAKDFFEMGLERMGLPSLPWAPFEEYLSLLRKWNKVMNLTAIDDPSQIVERHFLDSLTTLKVIGDTHGSKIVSRETILDIGTGAGFPGLPLKIANPEACVTLVEPVKKKMDFLKELIRRLGLKNVRLVHRSLAVGDSIGKFMYVVSRAAFKLDEFVTMAVSNLERDGLVIAMKGTQGDISREIKKTSNILSQHKLCPLESIQYILPFSKMVHQLITTKLA